MSNDASTGNRLAGKVAIITGAASGIGLVAARRFVQEGARVVVVDLDEQKVAQVVDDLGAERALGFVADVTDEHRVVQLVAATVERFGKVDVYYNNAGIPMSVTPVEELNLAQWRRIMDVNATALFLAAKAVVFDSRIVDHYPKTVNRKNQPGSEKLLIEIGSHLSHFLHFVNQKTLPFTLFDGTVNLLVSHTASGSD